MRIRTAAAVALVAMVAAPGVAGAATRRVVKPKPLMFTDAAGDANALNGQGVGAPVPEQSTPAQADAFDIRSVTLVTDKPGTAATKLFVTLTLAAAPNPSSVYRVNTAIGQCTFWPQVYYSPNGVLDSSSVRVCDSTQTTGFADVDVSSTISGSSIVWTIPIKSFKSYGLKPGVSLGSLGADARINEQGATAPSVDLAASDKSYKVGS